MTDHGLGKENPRGSSVLGVFTNDLHWVWYGMLSSHKFTKEQSCASPKMSLSHQYSICSIFLISNRLVTKRAPGKQSFASLRHQYS